LELHRVAITGLGSVSAFGVGTPALWDALIQGRSGERPITVFEAAGAVACEFSEYDPAAHFPAKKLDMLDRFSQFGLLAAGEAIQDAGIEVTDSTRAGVSLGSGAGGAATQDDGYQRLYRKDAARVHPFTIPRIMYNAAASQISMEYGLSGPVVVFSTACASATHAIGEAFEMIRHGRADWMLAGGSEAPICYGFMKCWEAMRVLAPVCRPFSADRQGLVIGEGAGILVLEEWEHARKRGARIYAELCGYGATADAGHITQPGEAAPADALQRALDEANLNPTDIDYVNAHGTGTQVNDSTETRIVKRVFGGHARRLAISSTKSAHGHAMGATGGIELVATALAIHCGVIPPTVNYTTPDPECDLDYVPNCARQAPLRAALSNSFAFGGLNAVLALRKVG
jgi:nodulation protein E